MTSRRERRVPCGIAPTKRAYTVGAFVMCSGRHIESLDGRAGKRTARPLQSRTSNARDQAVNCETHKLGHWESAMNAPEPLCDLKMIKADYRLVSHKDREPDHCFRIRACPQSRNAIRHSRKERRALRGRAGGAGCHNQIAGHKSKIDWRRVKLTRYRPRLWQRTSINQIRFK